MQGSSALREEVQLGGFGLVLKVKEGDWILFFSDIFRNKAGQIQVSRAPGRQGLQSITSDQSADTAGVSWRVMSALFAHTAGRVVLEPPREQGGTEKTWGTCIQYSWASCFPQSQAVKERCTGLPGDGRALGGSLINGAESSGRAFAQDTASGFPVTTACPKTGHGGPGVQQTGSRQGWVVEEGSTPG